MEHKFQELRDELVEELDKLADLALDIKDFAADRNAWQDDEDDCLLAAHRKALLAREELHRVRMVLEEVP
jgi:hypothetical protein